MFDVVVIVSLIIFKTSEHTLIAHVMTVYHKVIRILQNKPVVFHNIKIASPVKEYRSCTGLLIVEIKIQIFVVVG